MAKDLKDNSFHLAVWNILFAAVFSYYYSVRSLRKKCNVLFKRIHTHTHTHARTHTHTHTHTHIYIYISLIKRKK